MFLFWRAGDYSKQPHDAVLVQTFQDSTHHTQDACHWGERGVIHIYIQIVNYTHAPDKAMIEYSHNSLYLCEKSQFSQFGRLLAHCSTCQ